MKFLRLSKLRYSIGYLFLAGLIGVVLVTSFRFQKTKPAIKRNRHVFAVKSIITHDSPVDTFSTRSFLVRNEQISETVEYRRLEPSKYITRFPVYRSNLNRTMKIILWTTWLKDPYWGQTKNLSIPFIECPDPKCVLTTNKSDVVNADAFMFHTPDYWNRRSRRSPLPKYRRWDQIYILQNGETPLFTPYNATMYNGVFNWTYYYRRNSDVVAPYFKIVKLKTRRKPVGDIASTKTKGIAWVASNCKDPANRQDVIREMQKYIHVDTYGRCGKMKLPREDTRDVLIKYKFYLAFENALCSDYITEKFAYAVLRHNIPVIQGDGGDYYKTLVPPNSYIDISKFNSVEEAVDYLKYLDKNETAFNSYFEWTKDWELISEYSNWCSMCRALHDEARPAQVYSDMVGHMRDDVCIKEKERRDAQKKPK